MRSSSLARQTYPLGTAENSEEELGAAFDGRLLLLLLVRTPGEGRSLGGRSFECSASRHRAPTRTGKDSHAPFAGLVEVDPELPQ